MPKILMVLTSHDQLGNTGAKTGFWLEEFAAPYYVFKDAGADVTRLLNAVPDPGAASRRWTPKATMPARRPTPRAASRPMLPPKSSWPAPSAWPT